MIRSVAEITEEALRLPKPQQFKLARALLENAEFDSQPGVEREWEEEIERRIQAIDAGRAKGRPFWEVLRKADALLAKA